MPIGGGSLRASSTILMENKEWEPVILRWACRRVAYRRVPQFGNFIGFQSWRPATGSGVAGVSRLWWPDGKLRMLLPITTASSKTRVRLSLGAPIIYAYSVKDNWSPTTVEV